MGNEGQQPPQPGQGQQGYFGWQYDQEHQSAMGQQPPAVPQSPVYPPGQQPPIYPPQAYPPLNQGERPPQLPSNYQDPFLDMGSTLGFGQGTEYQYFDAPQPSQPMPQLRQERFQQLREERLRRQQRRMKPDMSTIIRRKGQKFPTDAGSIPPSPTWGPTATPSMLAGAPPMVPPTPPLQVSQSDVAPVRSSTLVPPSYQRTPIDRTVNVGERLQPASTLSQDTGMIQRVNIRRATLILTGAFIASRILGLLRTSMFAFVFGASAISDAYLQAFLVPDLIFNIVAGGALSSAFIPVFTRYMVAEKDEKTAWHIASTALNLAIAIMIILALIAIIFAGQLVPLYNPKPANLSPANEALYYQHIALITNLTRIMFLQSILLGAGVITSSILNARQNFMSPAIGTVLYNVGLIMGLVPGFIFAYQGQRNDISSVYAATWGVVIGAVLQVGFQIPALFRAGMHYKPSFDWHHPGVIQIGRQMIPRIINAGMLYFSIFVDRYLIQIISAFLLTAAINPSLRVGEDGLITQYYQALQLVLLPLGIFGMAVSTAAFPTLAENVAKGRLDRVRSTILETVRSILFMSIPSSVALMVLGLPIIQVLLEHGHFSLDTAHSIVIPLAGFAVGLAGLATVEILTRSFYALRDSITPVIVSVGQFVFKIALSLLLINTAIWGAKWGVGGLALSTSIAGLLEAAILLWLLHQRIGSLQLRTLAIFIGRILLASISMGIAILVVRLILDRLLVTTNENFLGLVGTLKALIKLMVEISVGFFVYIRGSRLLGIEELGPVKRVLDRLKLSWI